MASLLVIGGSGFFGKSILDMFQAGKLGAWNVDKVIVMSRNVGRLMLDAPHLVRGDVELFASDMGTADFLPSADYVIHAAALTDARNYLHSGKKERENIQANTLNYCRLAQKFNNDTKTLYVSSGAVYGTQPPELTHVAEGYQFNDANNIPKNKRDYALAKRDAEGMIRSLGERGVSVSIARCFAFVGKYLPRDQHFAIGNFIEDGLSGRPIRVEANHMVYRSYMHANDLVGWMMTILESSGTDCPTYNVGSDESISIHGLAAKIASYFDVAIDSQDILSGKIDRYVPSIEKAFNQLGLRCSLNLDEAIDETVKAITK